MSTMPVTFQERVPLPLGPQVCRPGASSGFTFNDAVRTLKSRIFLVMFVWVFVVGITALGTYLMLRYHPYWDAKALVLVESPKPSVPLSFVEPPVTPELQERFVADQRQLVMSNIVLTAAAQDAELRRTHWFETLSNKDLVVDELEDALQVSAIKGTNYLMIRMITNRQTDPHVIVNTVMRKYLDEADRLTRTPLESQITKYKYEAGQLENKITENRSKRRRNMEDLSVPGVLAGVAIVGDALRQITTEITRVQAEKTEYRAYVDTLENVSGRDVSMSPEARMAIDNDPRVLGLTNTLQALQQQKLLAQSLYGPKHRLFEEIESQMSIVEEQLNQEIAMKQEQVRQYQLNQARMAYITAVQSETQLLERRAELEATQRDIDGKLAQSQDLEEEYVQLVDNYKVVDDYTRMLQLITDQRMTVRVYPVSNATMPLEVYFPKWYITMPIGAFLGLILAVGLALLLEIADTSVRSPSDIVRHVSVPILGTVPDLDDEEVAVEQVELAAHTAPRSMIAEAFRNIRTNLLLSAPAERLRTILVTSPKPGDGKTTIATNLAISVAQSGRRVLLIDANFRRPSLRQLFPEGSPQGLSNLLIGQARFENVVRTTMLPNLHVLASGPIPPNPAELLSSGYMRDLIAQVVERYDQVLIDGPPVLLVSDALVMASKLDGVILVCRAKANSRGIAQRARDQLERVNAHLFGAVLNAAQVRRGGYFREHLRTFYEYQPDEIEAGSVATLPHGEDERKA